MASEWRRRDAIAATPSSRFTRTGRSQDDDAEYDDDEYGGYAYDDEYDADGEEVYDDEAFLEGEGQYEYGDEYAYGYDYFYDDEGEEDQYGYYGDDWGAPACAPGTDCSDCGGPLGEDGQIKSWGDDASGDFDDDEWFDDKDGAGSASVFVTPSS
jgi:hypothetical protein